MIKIIDGETLVLLLQVYDRVYETKAKMYGSDTKVLYQSKTDPDLKVQKQYDILLGLVNNCIVEGSVLFCFLYLYTLLCHKIYTTITHT